MIEFIQKHNLKIQRLSLFIIFFWFGIIKLFNLSPAEELIKELFRVTILPLGFKDEIFFVSLLGFVECIIGILWLIPKFTKICFTIFCLQMFTTFGPLIFLPNITWQSFLIPTLVGQYIIKNIVLVALSINIFMIELKSNEV